MEMEIEICEPKSIVDKLVRPDIIDLVCTNLTIKDINNMSLVSKLFRGPDITTVFNYLLQKKKYEANLRTGVAQFYSMGSYENHENLLEDFLDFKNMEYSISFLREKINFSILNFLNQISVVDQVGCKYESVEDYFVTYLGNYIRDNRVVEKLKIIEQKIAAKENLYNVNKILGIPKHEYYLDYYAHEYNLILRQAILSHGTNLVYDAYIYKILKIVQKNNSILIGDIVHVELGINYEVSQYEGSKQYQDYLVSWDHQNNQKILILDDKGDSCFPPEIVTKLVNNKVTYSHANTQALQLFFHNDDWSSNDYFPWILPKCCKTINEAVTR